MPVNCGTDTEHFFGGHRVVCTRSDLGDRIWHCDCSEFERRLVEYREGFCEHVALAIRRAIEERQMTLAS